METAGMLTSTFSPAAFQLAQSRPPFPTTCRTARSSSLRGEKTRKQPEHQLQRSLSLTSNPRRTSAASHTHRTPRFSSLRGEKARKQPERSTFSLASFQSAQNHPPRPILAERHAFPLFAEKSAKTAGTLNVLPCSVSIRAELPPFPILAERHAFPLYAEKKRENSRNAQRFPRIVPIRAEPSAAPCDCTI